jgi:hypothetical protein
MKDTVQLPAFCTLGALAALGNVTVYMMRRLLRECGVRRVRAGRKALIPLAEIEKRIPLLFESLQLVESMRRTGKQGECRR